MTQNSAMFVLLLQIMAKLQGFMSWADKKQAEWRERDSSVKFHCAKIKEHVVRYACM